jgi:hypothetical protein
MMSKVQLTRAQVEMAQKLGLVKFEGGKMFLMNNTPQQVQWSQHNPAAQWGQSLVTLVAPKLQEVAKAVRAEERFTLDDMKGQVFTKVYVTDNKYEMIFENDEFIFTFYHEDDCCESVYVDDITGDLNDLVGKPLDIVEVARHEDTMPQGMDLKKPEDSFTWTFYKFATIKGWVDVRWLGESNGYYSEEVDFKGERK